MDTETRDLFKSVTSALEAQVANNAAQRQVNDSQREVNALLAAQVERLDARCDALQAAVRALATDPGEVADSILKVVRDDADA